jgi:X-X-X-Leu-X-X-Gly heptad repeat protein
VLLGRGIDLLRFPAPAPLARAWRKLLDGGNWVTRRAMVSGALATAVLAAIAVPALALKSGPPDVSQLPPSATARLAFEEVSRVMGPGWATPYDLIVVANGRPLTTPALLQSLYRLQLQIARDGRVQSVTGPGAITSTSTQLSSFGPQLRHSAHVSEQSKTDLLKLIDGLAQAGGGSAQLQAGLQQAASGSTQLHTGGGQARSGAAQLHAGLAKARTGSAQLAGGLDQALAGAVALRSGASKALAGASLLATGLGKGAPQVKAGLPAVGLLATSSSATVSEIKALQGQAAAAGGSLQRALTELQALSSVRSDPSYQAVLTDLTSASGTIAQIGSGLNTASGSAGSAALISAAVKSQVTALAPQLTAAASGAAALEHGIAQLRDGNAQLATGLRQLSGGGAQLTSGLDQLTSGAGALEIGLGQLSTGAGQLASGLAGGVAPAGLLTTGLGTMQAAVVKARGQIPSTAQLRQLQAQSPGIFNSGYFVLAAIEGATPPNRNAATFTINLLRGGTAGQIMVVSKYRASDPRTGALGTRLAGLARRFAKENNAQAAIGGPAGNLADLTHATKSRVWLDVAVLTSAILLILAIALRAVLLSALATAFALLTTAAAFGVLQLLFGGPNPPLSGPGYLDPITITSVFTIAFGISAIYSTLLLMRTREALVVTGRGREAVRVGLCETAAAATGAGLVMIAALVPFTATELLNVRALGIGVAVAVLLDVLIVRPVLLPAAEALLGRWGWWPTTGPRPAEPSTGPVSTLAEAPAIAETTEPEAPEPIGAPR